MTVWDDILGNDTTPVPLEQLPFQADQGTPASAMQAQRAVYNTWLSDISGANGPDRKLAAQRQPMPTAVTDQDVAAQQKASDRERLINESVHQYAPYIQQLQGASFNNVDANAPSAAMSTFQAASDAAANAGYGAAGASAGTGGQRGALMQAALGSTGAATQAAAGAAGQMRAGEHQTAVANQQQTRGLLAQALGAQGDINSALSNDDANVIKQDLDARIARDTAQNRKNMGNAASSGETARAAIGTGATLLTAI